MCLGPDSEEGRIRRLGAGERKRSVAFSVMALLIFLTWQGFLGYFSNWAFRAEGQTSVALTGEECDGETELFNQYALVRETGCTRARRYA